MHTLIIIFYLKVVKSHLCKSAEIELHKKAAINNRVLSGDEIGLELPDGWSNVFSQIPPCVSNTIMYTLTIVLDST